MVPCLYELVHGGYMSVPGGYLVLGVLLSCSGQLRRKEKGKKYWAPVYGEKQMVDADHDKIP